MLSIHPFMTGFPVPAYGLAPGAPCSPPKLLGRLILCVQILFNLLGEGFSQHAPFFARQIVWMDNFHRIFITKKDLCKWIRPELVVALEATIDMERQCFCLCSLFAAVPFDLFSPSTGHFCSSPCGL